MKNRLRRIAVTTPFWAKRLGINDVVVASRVGIPRNLAGLSFPHRLSPATKDKVLDDVRPFITDIGLKEYRVEEMDDADILLMWERGLYLGSEPDDPKRGKSIFMDRFEKKMVMVNELDHFWILTALPGPTLRRCLETATELERRIAEKHEFAFSPKDGYLTSWVEHHGVGARLSMIIHIPAITLDWRDGFAEWVQKTEFEFAGPFGVCGMPENVPLGGSMMQVFCSSQNEQEAAHNLDMMEKFAKNVTAIEIEHRLDPSPDALDIIGRIWGAMQHRMFSSESDATAGLQLALLGAWNGVVDEFEVPNIEKALYLSLEGHLMSGLPADFPIEGEILSEVRARFVKSAVTGRGK